MKYNRIVNVKNWKKRDINVGYGTRDKVVLKQSKMGKVYFIAKTYENNIGELRAEICASTIGRLYGFPVQKSWLCLIPQHITLGLKYDKGILIQLDVRRLQDFRRNQFKENLNHGLALISSVDKKFGRSNLNQRRKIYTLDLVIKALRNYTNNHSDAAQIWDDFFKLMCFDALIGGTDRHYNNWGVLEKAEDASFLRLAPAFDNGVSLLWNLETERTNIMREFFTRKYILNAKSSLRNFDGSKYNLYDILESLYSIPEYKKSNITNEIIKSLTSVSDGYLNRSILNNLPRSEDFNMNNAALGIVLEYVRLRKQLLIEKLSNL